ncbi:hypothetical protein [Brevifollis gellanilyticus]|uniref:Uncharacterized protein n=1 Tax=Brevifollis gellanilyticus TaxID=748831 RepID=A0A512M8Y9_9BACT|nr:hypothetical protein [Brevifollis gellanilyticus]GEP43207.1 hypothetical protein BGE01nite_24980 [Brevifollis gellanilyticus]
MRKLHLAYISLLVTLGQIMAADTVTDIGDRLEIFVDRALIDTMEGTTLQLGQPRPEEISLKFDQPWESNFSAAYMTVIKDGGTYRLYYRGGTKEPSTMVKAGTEVTCYAESQDGKTWVKPKLGLVEFEGSKDNNIILGPTKLRSSVNFTAMLDDRPGIPAAERYKGVGSGNGREEGLIRFVSPDGIHWKVYSEEIIFAGYKLDSLNVVSWLPAEQCYAIYMRAWSEGGTPGNLKPRDAYRTIGRATSKDFKTWSEPVRMQFKDEPKPRNLYSNATMPYFRAPHVLISMPHRMVSEEVVPRAELEAYKTEIRAIANSIGDVLLMSSRDGTTYDRAFMEAFVRPGMERGAWHARSLFASMGIVPTSADEMSFYVSTNYGIPSHQIRRYSLRTDGFASVHAGYVGGTMITKPIIFSGDKLVLNYWTSAAGIIRVELLDEAGKPLPGYQIGDCAKIIGNELKRIVTWKDKDSLSDLIGKPVRLRFRMTDADLYSFRFER